MTAVWRWSNIRMIQKVLIASKPAENIHVVIEFNELQSKYTLIYFTRNQNSRWRSKVPRSLEVIEICVLFEKKI
jgi:hypothetical protein